METRELLKITKFLVIGLLITPAFAFAYSTETHSNITRYTFSSYEGVYGEHFSNQETLFASQGSVDEDKHPRYLNHFYDPVHNKGLDRYLLKGVASPKWAVDVLEQGNYLFGEIHPHKPLFSSNTDYSWDRTVYEYVHGDREYAMRALGHQLHLVQDVTVPAHTRNDPHPPFFPNEADPYEDYTYGRTPNIEISADDMLSFSDLDSLVQEVANFTNKNFLSKDTVFKSYSKPSVDDIHFESGFGIHNTRGHKIIRGSQTYDRKTKKDVTEYFFDDKDGIISEHYWNILSKQAVVYGIATIDLFFREVEEERKTERLLAMNKSYKETERVMKALAIGRDSKASLTSLAAADIYELNKTDLDGYYAAAQIYGIHTPAAARDSALKDDQGASVLTGLQQAFQKTVVGEAVPEGTPPAPQKDSADTSLQGLQEQLNQASALLAFLQAQLNAREEKCKEESIRGPWDNFWWIGDKPGCDDPTPWIQKMFWAPIEGAGGSGVAAVSGSISANPSSDFFGTTQITWSTSGVNSCTVTGGIDSWTGTSGSEESGLAIFGPTTYTLSCDSGSVVETVTPVGDLPFEF